MIPFSVRRRGAVRRREFDKRGTLRVPDGGNDMKKLTSVLLALALCAALAGCANGASSASGSASGSEAQSASASASASQAESDSAEAAETPADWGLSDGLSEDGTYEGVDVLEYVTLPEDYAAIPVPAENCTASDEEVQEQVDTILANYAEAEHLTDVAVKDGDTVNIDYVGSVDGEEFDGGSTNGAGTDVVAGAANYIDDFLTQIIGHKPGETFDVNVTFPDPYENNPDLAGKDAVFETTINYVHGETVTPELTDEFVAENLKEANGWSTVDEMRAEIAEALATSKKSDYVWSYVLDNAEVSEIPQAVTDYENTHMLASYRANAAMYGISFEDMLTMMGYDSEDALIEASADTIAEQARQGMVFQAVSVREGMEITKDDVLDYFETTAGVTEDLYDQMAEVYGEPYLKLMTRVYLAQEFLLEHSVEG